MAKTKVEFRRFPEGDLIAIFPEIKWGSSWPNLCSYQRVGQHGGCSPLLLTELETPASDALDVIELREELVRIGYTL